MFSFINVGLCLLSVTGMSPLSPYLNVDPRYLIQVGAAVNIRVCTCVCVCVSV